MLMLTGPARAVTIKDSSEFLKEYRIEIVADLLRKGRALPGTFSLKANMSPVRDQQRGEVCATFAVASALEYVNGRIDLSEANLTDGAERAYGDCAAGMGLAPLFQYCLVSGIVTETDWPYDDNQICWAHPPNIGGRPRFRFSNIGAVFNRPGPEILNNMRMSADPHVSKKEHVNLILASAVTNSIKSALVNLARPVVLDVPVWFSISGHFDAGWDFGPDIHMPTPVHVARWLERNAASPGNIDGWHAIPVCGYDDVTSRFEFKNSWSPYWGNGGYGTIPYEYVETYSRMGLQGWL
jgi:Papain family cysteine protease